MKISETKDMTEPELNKKFRDLGDELLQLRVRKQTGQVEKPHLLKTLRRDRARVLTVLRQQQHSTN
jgi:large subunit ribosomal protein L29